jgi:hypothetical protein
MNLQTFSQATALAISFSVLSLLPTTVLAQPESIACPAVLAFEAVNMAQTGRMTWQRR